MRQARANLDGAYQCLLKTLLGGAEPHDPRMAFALAETLANEAAYVAAGGRVALLGASAGHAAPGVSLDHTAPLHPPPLAVYTFTELLLLREYLPRVVTAGPDKVSPGPCTRQIIDRSCKAVDREISVREQPFSALLRTLAQEAVAPEDLEGPFAIWRPW